MMCSAIAHHPLTNTQLVPERRVPAPTPPVYTLDGTSHGMEYPVGQFGSGAPAVSCANSVSIHISEPTRPLYISYINRGDWWWGIAARGLTGC